MKTRYTVALSMIAGAALGGVAVQGVHAQLTAKKAYTISELEVLDAQAAPGVAQRVQAAQAEAGGRNLRTGGGKVVGMEGPPPPNRVGLSAGLHRNRARRLARLDQHFRQTSFAEFTMLMT